MEGEPDDGMRLVVHFVFSHSPISLWCADVSGINKGGNFVVMELISFCDLDVGAVVAFVNILK